MRDEWPTQDSNRDAKWLEFCQKVDNGDFDAEIRAEEEALDKAYDRGIKEDLAKVLRPTTPDELIQSAIMEDMGREAEEGIEGPITLEQTIQDLENSASTPPLDARETYFLVMKRERFKKIPANFERFLEGK